MIGADLELYLENVALHPFQSEGHYQRVSKVVFVFEARLVFTRYCHLAGQTPTEGTSWHHRSGRPVGYFTRTSGGKGSSQANFLNDVLIMICLENAFQTIDPEAGIPHKHPWRWD